ncbi:hypothetical protein HYS82_00375 [Candidatus Amesbacteria bacterium]|nr:hypothetical protein [Candidatus Amesbacteria bacterium]
MSQIPVSLQPVLWSADVSRLDPVRDAPYIIHQTLSYGKMDDLRWIFTTYPKRQIADTFINHPYKDYRPSRFNFVKNYLLNLKNNPLDERHYVKNTPRDLG